MTDVFLSYAQTDSRMAERLVSDLRSLGVSVWVADELSVGTNIALEVSEALLKSKTLIVLVSENSSRSNWVSVEISMAIAAKERDRNRRIIPIMLSEGVRDLPFLRNLRFLDLTDDKDYAKVLSELETVIRRPNLPSNDGPEDTEYSELAVSKMRKAIESEFDRQKLAQSIAENELRLSRSKMLTMATTTSIIAGFLGFIGAVVTIFPTWIEIATPNLPSWLPNTATFATGLVFGVMAKELVPLLIALLAKKRTEGDSDD